MVRKFSEYLLIAFILLFAAVSIAGQIRFKRGATPPVSGEKGEPLWQTTGGYNGKGQLWIGYSTATGRTAYKAYSSYIGKDGCTPKYGEDYICNGVNIPGYYDGATVHPLFCNISGGTVSYQYNESGLTPLPASTPMKLRLWLGNTRITPKHNRWDASGIVYGNRTGALFTPSVQSSYITAGSMVAAQGAYSTTVGYGAKRWCTATTTVAHSKVGGVGATGPAGADATVTRLAMNKVMRNWSTQYAQSANDAWRMFPVSPDRTVSPPPLFRFGNYSRVTKIQIDGAGYMSFLDRNNYPVIKAGADGTLALYVNNVKWLDMTESKTVTVYRNGVPVHQVYSTGTWKGSEGWPTAAQMLAKKTALYTDQYGFRKYTSSGSGGGGAGMSNPYTIPGASQTFTSAAGRVRFTFYSGRGLVIH